MQKEVADNTSYKEALDFIGYGINEGYIRMDYDEVLSMKQEEVIKLAESLDRDPD